MAHKEQIALYLSGRAGKSTERRTENALLRDAGFLESFIETVEQCLYAAPYGLAAAVMNLLPNNPAAAIKVPVLNRKLGAAVCFCSAAAIMLFFVSGFGQQAAEFISAHADKLGDLFAFTQNLTIGGQ